MQIDSLAPLPLVVRYHRPFGPNTGSPLIAALLHAAQGNGDALVFPPVTEPADVSIPRGSFAPSVSPTPHPDASPRSVMLLGAIGFAVGLLVMLALQI